MSLLRAGSGSIQAATSRQTAFRRYPVVYWAAIAGSIMLAFELYILVKWISGPNFVAVPYGPSELPRWLKLSIDIAEPLSVLVGSYCFWRLSIRPWLRERQVTTFGLLCPALVITSLYDSGSAYFRNWFGYNAYFLNYGNPLPGSLPGWQSFAEPGAMAAFPIVFIPALYPVLFLSLAWICIKFMGMLRDRFPRLPSGVVVILTFAFGFLVDAIVEGNITLRLGWYTEIGPSFLNAGEYYQLPTHNAVGMAFVMTAMASLCYFRDDRGYTFIERGVERFPRSSGKEIVLRFLALLAATQIIVCCYNVAVAFYVRGVDLEYPETISSKSYFNNHICGFDTPRACPADPAVK